MAMVPRAHGVPVSPEEAEGRAPQIITPMPGPLDGWEWSQSVRPPYLNGTWQEPWSKVVQPVRFLALAVLWLTWHWARCAVSLLFLVLIVVFIAVR